MALGEYEDAIDTTSDTTQSETRRNSRSERKATWGDRG